MKAPDEMVCITSHHGKGKFQYPTGAVYSMSVTGAMVNYNNYKALASLYILMACLRMRVERWRDGMHGQGKFTSTNMDVFSKLVALDRKFKPLLKTTLQIATKAIYLKLDPSPNAEGLNAIINGKHQNKNNKFRNFSTDYPRPQRLNSKLMANQLKEPYGTMLQHVDAQRNKQYGYSAVKIYNLKI